MKIIWVAGARPNFMKVAPIWRAIQVFNAGRATYDYFFDPVLVHTGQHYDVSMSDVFFEELGLPKPDYFLGVSGGTHGDQVARIMVAFEEILYKERPDAVGVVGDVNSTVACALASSKSYLHAGGKPPRLIHVEAGLRSGDRLMPEEVNRLVTDVLADYLFTSERSGSENLRREGVPGNRIFFVGNVMIDSLVHVKARERAPAVAREMGLVDNGGEVGGYGLVTLHRPSNVDDKDFLFSVIGELKRISRSVPIIFPMHPRTRARAAEAGLAGEDTADGRGAPLGPGLHIQTPLAYRAFTALLSRASFVVTDSGGIQEETTFFGVPCLTLRENTERPVTVEVGTNKLLGRKPELLAPEIERVLSGNGKSGAIPPLWDGRTAERIVEVLAGWLESPT